MKDAACGAISSVVLVSFVRFFFFSLSHKDPRAFFPRGEKKAGIIKVYLFFLADFFFGMTTGGGGSLTPKMVGMNDIKVYLFLAEIVSE